MFFFFKFLIQIICQLNIMCVFICINSLTLYFILNFVYKTFVTIPLDFDLIYAKISSKEQKNSS